MSAFKDRDALYYPYVHVRDVEWLKRTLLIFPHVVRMVPKTFSPRDDPAVQQFCRIEGKRGALLRQARLDSDRVIEAQAALMLKIMHDVNTDPGFLERFDRKAADATKTVGDRGFQMYPDKISDPLFHCLRNVGLAWNPANPDHDDYVELHPRLGQAVMGTVAVACASDEGLAIVTEKSQRSLSNCLAVKDLDAIYTTWVHGEESSVAPKVVPEGGRLLEIVVYQHCDVSKLTPEKLARLGDDRTAMANLHQALQNLASIIPDNIEDDETLKKRLQDTANDALKRWQQDQLNLSGLAKDIYRSEGVKGLGKLFGELLVKNAAPSGAAAALGAANLGLPPSQILAIAGSTAIGVLVTSAVSVQKQARESPYRYLTLMEKAGVSFTLGASPHSVSPNLQRTPDPAFRHLS